MMTELVVGLVSAFWLGILTSISPCPLATNIAAISFVAKDLGNRRRVLISGLFYTAGRMLTYSSLGMLLAFSLLSAPAAAQWLQQTMNRAMGPLLILVGMVLLDLLALPAGTGTGGWTGHLQSRAEKLGTGGGLLLGVVFALAFCPVSAALFFGSLLPVAVQCRSPLLVPAVYGLATGLPVAIFAILLAAGANAVGKAYNSLRAFELWARRATGAVFILVGIYLSLRYIFGVGM